MWRGPNKDQEPLRSCTIITTTPNSEMAKIHDRMPVILPASAWDTWLDREIDDLELLGKLLVPAPPEIIQMHTGVDRREQRAQRPPRPHRGGAADRGGELTCSSCSSATRTSWSEGELLLGGIDTAAFLREAVEHVNRLDPQPDLVLLTGDLVNEGRPEEYEHLRELLEPLRAPYHLVPGNHDLTDELRAAFPDHVHGDRRARRRRDRGAAAGRHPRQLPLPGARRLARSRAARVARPDAGGGPRPADGRRRAPPAVRDGHQAHGHDGARRGVRGGAGRGDRRATRRWSACSLATCTARISRRFAGTIAMTAPGTAHAVQLDLGDGRAAWNHEPPAILLHLWTPEGGVVTHLEVIGDHHPVSFGI